MVISVFAKITNRLFTGERLLVLIMFALPIQKNPDVMAVIATERMYVIAARQVSWTCGAAAAATAA